MGKYRGTPHRKQKFPAEVRIGAVADYLLGRPMSHINHKWGVSNGVVFYWVRRVGCFKMRRNNKPKPKRLAPPANRTKLPPLKQSAGHAPPAVHQEA